MICEKHTISQKNLSHILYDRKSCVLQHEQCSVYYNYSAEPYLVYILTDNTVLLLAQI